MIELKTKIRKWGNSFGIVIPLKKVNQQGIKEGDEVRILLNKEKDNVLRETFGILKNWKKPTEKIMREIDEELWPEDE